MVKVTEADLEDEFGTFSISVDGSEVIERLQQFCLQYRLTAEAVVEQWVAFCSTKKQNMKKVTIDALEHLERDRLCKKDSARQGGRSSTAIQPSSVQMYNVWDMELLDDVDGAEDDDDPILKMYATPNGKGVTKKRQHTPESITNKRPGIAGRSPAASIGKSPGSQNSPVSANMTPSQRYASRGNALEVVVTYGAGSASLDARHYPTISVFDQESSLNAPYKYMFQKVSDQSFILNDLIVDMSNRLKNSGITEDFSHVALPAQESVTVVGRVCCDGNGKLNSSSLLLEGGRDTSAGRYIALDVSNVPMYSLFPGQVLAVDGTNYSGKKFVASKIHEGIFLPGAPLPVHDVSCSLVIAAGPFSTSDNLLYEPLKDLAAYLQKGTPPDICILLGPFVDIKHPLLEKGDIGMTYEQFMDAIKPVVDAASRCKIQLLIVPSYRDIHHDFVYPQPPFSLPVSEFVHLVSDPCTLDIDGLAIGVTSTDILFHLGAEEISSGQTCDRIARLAQHILKQHTYYPLYPPHVDVPFDLEHFDVHCRLPVTPNLLVLPSDLRCFIKDVGETVCVNPGRMAKGQVGGTFARVSIDYKGSKSQSDVNSASFIKSVSAEIIRI